MLCARHFGYEPTNVHISSIVPVSKAPFCFPYENTSSFVPICSRCANSMHRRFFLVLNFRGLF